MGGGTVELGGAGRPGGRVRAVWLAHAFPRFETDLPGGFVLRLAAALADRGVQVEVLAPAAPGVGARERFGAVAVRRYRYAPGRWQTLAYTGAMQAQAHGPAGRLALGGLLASGALAARRAAAGADLVHAHWWFPGGLQALAARSRPLVVTLHGSDVRLALDRPGARALCARVLRAAAAVTAVSSWLAREAAELAPEQAGRIRVAPMPADDATFTPGHGPRDELLFVGRLDRQKGLDVALHALARLRGPAGTLPLRVVGSGRDEAALRRLAAELGVAARVVWAGTVPQAELAACYRRAAALLVPGRDEGFGLVAVEGQLAAAPVVAAASGGLVDIVADGATGRTFPPGEPAALAGVLEQLAADPHAAARLGEAGRRAAVARFGTRAAAAAYAEVYAEVLAGVRGGQDTRGRRRRSPG